MVEEEDPEMLVESFDPLDQEDQEEMFGDNIRSEDEEEEEDPFVNMFARESNYNGGSDDEGPGRKSSVKHNHRGTFVGTPLYVSPEMLTKSTSGPFTDLWSLGVIIFQMLTGELPFTGPEFTMYQLIKTRKIRFPNSMPLEAVDLIDKLL